MKKILLLFACSGIVLATAQNNVTLTKQKQNNNKLSVREVALQKKSIPKRPHKGINQAKNNNQNHLANICYADFYPYIDSLNNVTFFDDSYSDSTTIVSWLWDFGDSTNATSPNPTHQYAQSGTYNVCLTINSSSCTNTVCYPISVNDGFCYSSFYTFEDSLNQVTFTDLSYSDSTVISWLWDFGDSTTSTNQNPVHQYAQSGTYYACLTITSAGGCVNTYCKQVDVNPTYCYSYFTFSADSSNNVAFTDLSSTTDSSIVSWLWDFGDSTTSTSPNPVHQYAQSGTYTVCLTINSIGCANTSCYQVNVNDYINSCTAYFSISGTASNYYFSDLSSAGIGIITSWSWGFGDGQIDTTQNPSHTYTQSGNYYVCLTITTDLGCTSTFCKTVGNQGISGLIVDSIPNLTQTISSMLFGSCVTVSNLTYTGSPSAIGYFADNDASIDSAFTYGLLLTTGSIFDAVGPNNSTSSGTSNSLPGDNDLDLLVPGYDTFDASIIEFDFTSVSDTVIASRITFGSEEYPEFVGSSFNDVFGFFISGPGISGVKNLALLPGTIIPISVNSVNPDSNSIFYVDNTNGLTYQYDGRTTVIELSQSVIPGQTYHFKIAIADAGDHILDSGVLIEAGSFSGNTQLPQANFTATETSNLTVNFNNASINANLYGWDFGDGTTGITTNPTHTYAAAGTYTVTLYASNVCYTDSTSTVITVGANGISALNGNNSIKIIPTAAVGVYNAIIQSSSNEKIEVRIYNVSGQLVQVKSYYNSIGQNNYSLDLSDYSHGLYTVQIVGNKELFTSKIIR